jgi:tRNA 2-selenouridine synthase
MGDALHIDPFLELSLTCPVIDVRSPGEFADGHIVGAQNLPLFTDEERAAVGTCYKQRGKPAAIRLGLDAVGPKLGAIGDALQAASHGGERRLLFYCARGGMRSASVAWLAETIGLPTARLARGYRAYRQWALETFALPRPIRVIGGLTGSGKTHVLLALRAAGASIIDLEALAHHKGSAFGSLGESPQPTQEQFENELATAWRTTPPDQIVWLEDESRHVGKRIIPEPLWTQKEAAPFFILEIPLAVRQAHLARVYAGSPTAEVVSRIEILRKRLGGLRTQSAIDAVHHDDLSTAVGIVLDYYDKRYTTAMSKLTPGQAETLAFSDLDPPAIAAALLRSTHATPASVPEASAS